MVCLRNICINTLHKGDSVFTYNNGDDDDDDNNNNMEAIPGKHSTDLLQKIAILGTAHTIRKVLQCDT
jgi:hypothetical protein